MTNKEENLSQRDNPCFWQEIRSFYETRLFCDLELKCDEDGLKCHQIVMASISGLVRRALLSNPVPVDPVVITIPHFPLSSLRALVNSVYRALVNIPLSADSLDESLLDALDIHLTNDKTAFKVVSFNDCDKGDVFCCNGTAHKKEQMELRESFCPVSISLASPSCSTQELEDSEILDEQDFFHEDTDVVRYSFASTFT